MPHVDIFIDVFAITMLKNKPQREVDFYATEKIIKTEQAKYHKKLTSLSGSALICR